MATNGQNSSKCTCAEVAYISTAKNEKYTLICPKHGQVEVDSIIVPSIGWDANGSFIETNE